MLLLAKVTVLFAFIGMPLYVAVYSAIDSTTTAPEVDTLQRIGVAAKKLIRSKNAFSIVLYIGIKLISFKGRIDHRVSD